MSISSVNSTQEESLYEGQLYGDESYSETERPNFESELEGVSFRDQMKKIVADEKVFSALEQKFEELNIKNIETRLGVGNHGAVYQIEGSGVLPHEKLALKVHRFAQVEAVEISGEALALTMPHHRNLNRIYGLLTYDGETVHYVDSYEGFKEDHLVVGLFSEVIHGKNLFEYALEKESQADDAIPLTIEDVENLISQIPSAMLALHKNGISYGGGSLHSKNVFVEIGPDGKPNRLVLGDFGHARKFSQEETHSKLVAFIEDWEGFGDLDDMAVFTGPVMICFEHAINELNRERWDSPQFSTENQKWVDDQSEIIMDYPYSSAEMTPIVIAPAPEPKKPVQLISISLKELKQKDFQLVGAHAKNKKAIRSIQWDVSRNVAVIEKDGKFRVYQIGAGGAPALFSHKKLSEVTKFLNVM